MVKSEVVGTPWCQPETQTPPALTPHPAVVQLCSIAQLHLNLRPRLAHPHSLAPPGLSELCRTIPDWKQEPRRNCKPVAVAEVGMKERIKE